MSQLLQLENICLAYGLNPLLDNVKFQITKGERVCLIGRNGAGKSSFMKVIDGSIKPDSGSIWRQPHLKISRLEQELPQNLNISIYEYVAQGLEGIGSLLSDYYKLTEKIAENCSESDLVKLQKLQQEIDVKHAWQFEQNIKTTLTKLNLDASQIIANLSGGWQRRAALAKALVSSPELLLLDEPTNHLDVETIQWLEDQLISSGIALLFITHDRSLLNRLATRILELDRGQLTSWPGDYQNFLRRKEEMLHAEEKQNSEFDKKLAQEEKWIRQGIKARRTRNEGRVRALQALRVERSKRIDVQGNVVMNVNEAEQSGKLVIVAEHIDQQFNQTPIIKDFSIRIMRGDRIGLIGANGVGKSTLLNILLGNLQPQAGKVKQGSKLQIRYFDQLRSALDPEKTVMDNVIEGCEFIEINGEKKHIISYLGDFLFTPERAMTAVKALSGGECNRLLLARLFTQPANLLVMDEPTNDLDIETLELLEEILTDYPGTLLLVSHDRAFLDNVVTSTLVFEGQGKISEYVGGYETYLQQLRQKKKEVIKPSTEKVIVTKKEVEIKNKKLSYKEQRELQEIPHKIEQLEQEKSGIETLIADVDFYKQDAELVKKTMEKLTQMDADLKHLYARWEELEGK